MGGEGSGRKFRWKAILIPKNPMIAVEYPSSFIRFADNPRELLVILSKMEYSLFYEIKKIEITRARGKREHETKEMVIQRIREAERHA